MTASGRSGVLASALGAAVDWLIEPAEPDAPVREAVPETPAVRPVVAVTGLARRCGTTTVARGLGAELAARDPSGACVVVCEQTRGGPRLGLPAALRLASGLARAVMSVETTAQGRICLVGGADQAAIARTAVSLAPVVLDVEDPALAGAAASLADATVLVATPATEPALAVLVADRLARVGPEPALALNRDDDADGHWPVGAVRLPDTRMGAQLALAGRRARGRLGRALGELADACTRV